MRPLALSLACSSCLGTCIGDCDQIANGIGTALACSIDDVISESFGSIAESLDNLRVVHDDAVSTENDGGDPTLQVFYNVPGGWLHVTYFYPVTSGDFPQADATCGASTNTLYFHDSAGAHAANASSTVYSGGDTPGALYDVAFTGITYSCLGASDQGCSVPDQRMTLTVHATLDWLDGGAEDAAAEEAGSDDATTATDATAEAAMDDATDDGEARAD